MTVRQVNPADDAPGAREAIDRAVGHALAGFDRPDHLLPALHAIQDALGHIPEHTLGAIAAALKLSRAEVQGVIGFYHHFRLAPPGRHTVRLCRAEACQAMGARDLEAHARRRLGVDYHQNTADGAVSLEPVYCLGNCALSPAVMVDGELHGRVDPARFDALIDALGQPA